MISSTRLLYPHYIKRSLDLIISIICFALALPLLLLITLLLTIANRGKPFFRQVRPGKHEKLFTLIKFRTMSDRRDTDGKLLQDEKRLTGIGRWIRKTSLDEMPQLLNVMMGDMSLIGPRPLLPDYLTMYTVEQRKRHDVKPGITGWAQVNGRNAISWQHKFELDTWYVQHMSFALDCKIMMMTLKKVVNAEGISNAESATMPYFKGADSI